MRRALSALVRLEGEQERASAPGHHAALAASAGTGKTHVLTARVLRLLLSGADPAGILCLTFTKAGAAEMADRIHARLAHWVRLDTPTLRKELFALGEANGPEELEAARRLFARVLDAPGSGLRIQTIHAFAQSLLGSFPAEAGLTPGFRPIEGREQQQLAHSVLADMLVAAEEGGDLPLIADLHTLSIAYGEQAVRKLLDQAARAPEAMAALGPREGIEPRVRTLFNIPIGDLDERLAELCGDEKFDVAAVAQVAALNRAWATKTGHQRADACDAWLGATPAERVALLPQLHLVWAKADGEMRSMTSSVPKDEGYAALCEGLFAACGALLALRAAAASTAIIAASLRAGQTYARVYAEAKALRGLVDFDDLIRSAAALLSAPGSVDWIRYKLDQRTDHILVDEAQDTNAHQWEIIGALVDEFFAGQGGPRGHRTLFTVGDFKQAIYSFQGTSPSEFEKARKGFKDRADEARANALVLRDPDIGIPPEFLDLSIDRSFRSAAPVLEAVDAMMGSLGHQALGLANPSPNHVSHHDTRPGSVTLWRPFAPGEEEPDEGEEGWLTDAVRAYATQLAKQVRSWLDAPFQVTGDDGKPRALRPEDVLILVRSRSELAGLIVARLHAAGVPVAGIDRLNLKAPLAVQDLLAAARFAVQPLDDLNLAALLVSPLVGWTQEQLYEAGFGRGDRHLWERLREREGQGPDLQPLRDILDMADFTPPYDFFERLLSTPEGGRRAMLERLGTAARDPIEELLSSALEFEANQRPSLGGFLAWIQAGEVEVVRDPSAPLDAVRVMTVHGAKGLEAPVVILADAAADPDRMGGGTGIAALAMAEDVVVPVPRPRRDDRFEPLRSSIEDKESRDREEHWRLLYVAMTRARDRLFVGGALNQRSKGVAPEASWHRAIADALTGLGAAPIEDEHWGGATHHGHALAPGRREQPELPLPPSLPDWATRAARIEARPSRPLAPSAPREDDAPYPPPTIAMRQAMARGRLLHRLFERLPAVDPAERRVRADAFLEQSGEADDAAFRAAIIDDALAIIDDPAFAGLFAADALAEAPIAAVVASGDVVAGTVDRLCVTPDRILVADFKTGRHVPAAAESAPPSHLRQMAAYRDALRVIFPGRRIEAALLYTAGPILLPLPDALLDTHAPGS